MEEVEILLPPLFEPSGETMRVTDAIVSGKWLATVNVWVYRKTGETYEFLFQERPLDSPWMPGRLDVAVGGYLTAGENKDIETQKLGALREMQEELGFTVDSSRVWFVTKRLNSSISQKGNERKSCISIFALEFSPADRINLDVAEVTSVCWVPLFALRELHSNNTDSIDVIGIDALRKASPRHLTIDNFIPNYDDYPFFMPEVVMMMSVAKA